MQRQFLIFLPIKLLNSSLPYRQQIRIIPTASSSKITPIQILAILSNLLRYVSSVRKTGVTRSSERVSSFHPSFHGFIARISRYKRLCR